MTRPPSGKRTRRYHSGPRPGRLGCRCGSDLRLPRVVPTCARRFDRTPLAGLCSLNTDRIFGTALDVAVAGRQLAADREGAVDTAVLVPQRVSWPTARCTVSEKTPK